MFYFHRLAGAIPALNEEAKVLGTEKHGQSQAEVTHLATSLKDAGLGSGDGNTSLDDGGLVRAGDIKALEEIESGFVLIAGRGGSVIRETGPFPERVENSIPSVALALQTPISWALGIPMPTDRIESILWRGVSSSLTLERGEKLPCDIEEPSVVLEGFLPRNERLTALPTDLITLSIVFLACIPTTHLLNTHPWPTLTPKNMASLLTQQALETPSIQSLERDFCNILNLRNNLARYPKMRLQTRLHRQQPP